MKKFFALLMVLVIPLVAFGASKRFFQQIRLADGQALMETKSFTTPIVASATRILGATATSSSAITTVTTFANQPDVCRTLSVTPGGTTADVPAGDVVITGLNVFGKTITENITFAANASAAVNGTKAFCSVSSIVFPIQDGAAATYTVGVLDQLGLDRCMANAGHGVFAIFNNAYETTRGTWVADDNEVEKNTYDPTGTLDGAKTVKVFYVQNHGCYP